MSFCANPTILIIAVTIDFIPKQQKIYMNLNQLLDTFFLERFPFL